MASHYGAALDAVAAEESFMPSGAVPQQVAPNAASCSLVRSAPLTAERRPRRERATALRMVTACIAHEVNQPLSGIMTNASTCLRLLSADPPNVEGARDTALRTLRDVNRAAEVINRLCALFVKSEPSTGCPERSTPATESLDVNQVVQEAIALAQSDLYARRVAVTLDLQDGLGRVTGDRIQLQQVLLNLIRNASESMNAVHDSARTLTIATRREGSDQLRISVQDVGIGFADQDAGKLFTPFYTTKIDGMGIGLCISRSIVENHRGRLWGTPNLDGPGATFCLALPCEAQQSSQYDRVDVARPIEPEALELESSL